MPITSVAVGEGSSAGVSFRASRYPLSSLPTSSPAASQSSAVTSRWVTALIMKGPRAETNTPRSAAAAAIGAAGTPPVSIATTFVSTVSGSTAAGTQAATASAKMRAAA